MWETFVRIDSCQVSELDGGCDARECFAARACNIYSIQHIFCCAVARANDPRPIERNDDEEARPHQRWGSFASCFDTTQHTSRSDRAFSSLVASRRSFNIVAFSASAQWRSTYLLSDVVRQSIGVGIRCLWFCVCSTRHPSTVLQYVIF